jgi:hypothetical protein
MAQAKRASAVPGSPGRRQSREEGLALVQEWQTSGLRPAEFCRARGIAEHRLHYWKRRSQFDEAEEGRESGAFFAMTAPASGTAAFAVPEAMAEICVTGSLRVRVSLAVGREAFVQALRGVLEVVAS